MQVSTEFNNNLYKQNYKKLFTNLLHYNRTSLKNTIFLLQVMWYQWKANNTRKQTKKNGTEVPPLIFLSITKSCNLNCKGCYQKAQTRSSEKEMSTEKIISVLKEGEVLGSSVVGILGGEPFMRKDIFTIAGSMKKMIFAVFTNGILIDDGKIKQLKQNKNIIPIISNEGSECETDDRRGVGVYDNFRKVAQKFKENNIIFGVSFTVTSNNFEIVNDEVFIKELVSLGSTIFFYMDYQAIDGISSNLTLNEDQLKVLEDYIDTFRLKYNAQYFSPASEKRFGGCFGAGNGLIHINYDGSVEPCPFAPISDMNLHNVTLKEALSSDFMRIIRENRGNLEETNEGGCTLWENREWLFRLKKVEEEITKAG